jgi:hypothetical protein
LPELAGQTLPQPPQFDGSTLVSRQTPPQQLLPAAQAFPHVPQFMASLPEFTQTPPHLVNPGGHATTPPLQNPPTGA